MPQSHWGTAAPAGLRARQNRWVWAGHHGLQAHHPQRGSAGPAGQSRAGPGTGQPYLWTPHPQAMVPPSGLQHAPAARRPHAVAGACSAEPACGAARRLAATRAHSPQTACSQASLHTWLQDRSTAMPFPSDTVLIAETTGSRPQWCREATLQCMLLPAWAAPAGASTGITLELVNTCCICCS